MINEEAIKETQERLKLSIMESNVSEQDYHRTVFHALRKQTPKKPIWTERQNKYNEPIHEAWCPMCECEVDRDRDNFCPCCGQSINWSDEE